MNGYSVKLRHFYISALCVFVKSLDESCKKALEIVSRAAVLKFSPSLFGCWLSHWTLLSGCSQMLLHVWFLAGPPELEAMD